MPDFVQSIKQQLIWASVKFDVLERDNFVLFDIAEHQHKIALIQLKKNGVFRVNDMGIPKGSKIVWEDQWMRSPTTVEGRVEAMVGDSMRFHARDTDVCTLDQPQFRTFLEENHSGEPIKAKHKFGLTHLSELVAVAGFSKPCPYDGDRGRVISTQLVRFCNLSGHTIVGGLSKLLKHAIRQMDIQDIMTYVDLDWADGDTYKRLGFRETGLLAPPDVYVNLNSWQRTRTQPSAAPFALVAGRGSKKLNLQVDD